MKEYPKRREKSRASINCSESKAECVVVKPWGLKGETYPTGKFRSLSGNFLIGSHITQRKRAEVSETNTEPCWKVQVTSQRHQIIITLSFSFAARSKIHLLSYFWFIGECLIPDNLKKNYFINMFMAKNQDLGIIKEPSTSFSSSA